MLRNRFLLKVSKEDPDLISVLKQKSRFEIFCSCFSVRGIPKLCVGPTALRIAWFIFLLFMTSFLITSIALLILDYLNYDATVNSIIKLDDYSPFPSITVCQHDPYSKTYYEKWRSNKSDVRSPYEFQQMYDKIVQDVVSRNEANESFLLWLRNKNVYYQNLKVEEALAISHNISVYYGCTYMMQGIFYYENDCTKLDHYKVKTYSDPTYFNCHTFEPIISEQGKIERFGIIAQLNSRLNKTDQRQLFLENVFEQATGLLVSIHEPGTKPNIEKDGIHIEPGKMNEINYESTRREHLDTPTRPCLNDTSQSIIMDLGQSYNYTESSCNEKEIQKEIIKNCNCIYALSPRIETPTKDRPYCGALGADLKTIVGRVHCISEHISNKFKDIVKERKWCIPKCTYHSYSVTTSVTKWRAHHWQLYWLKYLNDLFAKYGDHGEAQKIKDGFEEFSKHKVLPESREVDSDFDLDSEEFAYIVVKRKSNDTIVQKDRLVLSMAVLLSRIGGLCSLTIGLTAAVVVELVEFSFLMYKVSKERKRERELDDMNLSHSFQKRNILPQQSAITCSNILSPDERLVLQSLEENDIG